MGASGHAEAVSRILAGKAGGEKLREYLLAKSNLPGPRANLGLVGAFADSVGELGARDPRKALEACLASAPSPSVRPPATPRQSSCRSAEPWASAPSAPQKVRRPSPS
jgi:hypothetical protein